MGLVSMMQRFLGGGGGGGRQSLAKRAATQTTDRSAAADVNNSLGMGVPRGLSHSPVTPTNEFFVPQARIT